MLFEIDFQGTFGQVLHTCKILCSLMEYLYRSTQLLWYKCLRTYIARSILETFLKFSKIRDFILWKIFCLENMGFGYFSSLSGKKLQNCFYKNWERIPKLHNLFGMKVPRTREVPRCPSSAQYVKDKDTKQLWISKKLFIVKFNSDTVIWSPRVC